MSVRSSKVFVGPIHIYEQMNEYDDDGFHRICLANVDGPKDNYTGGTIIKRSELREIYNQLKIYFDQESKGE